MKYDASKISTGTLSADKIKSGNFDPSSVPYKPRHGKRVSLVEEKGSTEKFFTWLIVLLVVLITGLLATMAVGMITTAQMNSDLHEARMACIEQGMVWHEDSCLEEGTQWVTGLVVEQ